MTNEELRCEALRRALELGAEASSTVVERAEAFYEFLCGNKPAAKSKAKKK